MKIKLKFISLIYICLLCLVTTSHAAMPDLNFTVTMDEPVIVDTASGTPRIQLNVGGKARYASYASGSGTSALTFTYAPTAGDADLDGIALTSPLELNGGAITDLSGNAITDLSFTVPTTSGVRINYPSLSMNFTADSHSREGTVVSGLTNLSGVSFSRASTATYTDCSGAIQTASTNEPRLDCSTGTQGLLMERARTNLLVRSNSFFSHWSQHSNADLFDDQTSSPDSSNNADRFNRTATGPAYISAGTSKNEQNIEYTLSIYAKANVGDYIALRLQGAYPSRADGIYNLSSGTVDTVRSVSNFSSENATITNVGNDWYRITLTATSDLEDRIRAIVSFNSNGVYIDGTDSTITSSGYVYGAQLEEGSFATSYIPTSGSTVTRAPDQLSVDIDALDLSNGYSLYTHGLLSAVNGSFDRVVQLDSNGNNDRQTLLWWRDGDSFRPSIYSNNSLQAVINAGGVLGSSFKEAHSASPNQFDVIFDGSSVLNDTSVDYNEPTNLWVASSTGGGGNQPTSLTLYDMKLYAQPVAQSVLEDMTQ